MMSTTIALAIIAAASAFLALLLVILKDKTQSSPASHYPKSVLQEYLKDLNEIDRQVLEKKIDASEADRERIVLLEKATKKRKREGLGPRLLLVGTQTPVIATLGAIALASLVGLFTLPEAMSTNTPKTSSAQTGRTQINDTSVSALQDYLKGSPIEETLQSFPQSRPASLPDVETMIGRLVARLEKNPEDAAGWRTLGWSNFQMKKYSEAVNAYSRALKLEPNSIPVKVAYGEAMVMEDGGNVKIRSINLFKAILELAPSNPRARFFIGNSKEQAGDLEGALKDWNLALNSASTSESWVADLKTKVQKAQDKDVAALASTKPVIKQTPPSSLKTAQVEKSRKDQTFRLAKTRAASMAPDERQAMIQGMVDRLDERLQSSPKDEEGWIRLMQSRMVLGQTSAAKIALANAMAAFSEERKVQARIAEKARTLGIKEN